MKPGLLLYLVGLDDVGMRKSNDRFRFAVELPDKSRLITHFLPEHFQGNMPPAHGVPGFEHLADAPLAQLIENLVGPDLEIVPPSGEQQLQLVGSEPIHLDEVLSQTLGVAIMGNQFADDLLGLLVAEQLHTAKNIQQSINTFDGHERVQRAGREFASRSLTMRITAIRGISQGIEYLPGNGRAIH